MASLTSIATPYRSSSYPSSSQALRVKLAGNTLFSAGVRSPASSSSSSSSFLTIRSAATKPDKPAGTQTLVRVNDIILKCESYVRLLTPCFLLVLCLLEGLAEVDWRQKRELLLEKRVCIMLSLINSSKDKISIWPLWLLGEKCGREGSSAVTEREQLCDSRC